MPAPSPLDEPYRLPPVERDALRSEVDVAALEQLLGRLPPEARHLILLLCRSGFSNRQLGDAIREAGGEELLDGETEQTRVLVPRFADSDD